MESNKFHLRQSFLVYDTFIDTKKKKKNSPDDAKKGAERAERGKRRRTLLDFECAECSSLHFINGDGQMLAQCKRTQLYN